MDVSLLADEANVQATSYRLHRVFQPCSQHGSFLVLSVSGMRA